MIWQKLLFAGVVAFHISLFSSIVFLLRSKRPLAYHSHVWMMTALFLG